MFYLFAMLFLFITFMATLMIGYGPIISSFEQSQHINIYQYVIDIFDEEDEDWNRIRSELESRTEAVTYYTWAGNNYFLSEPDVPDGHEVKKIDFLYLNTPHNIWGRGWPDMNLAIPLLVDRQRPDEQKYRFFDQKFESIYFPDRVHEGAVWWNSQIIKRWENYFDFGEIEADIRLPQLKLYLGYLYAYCQIPEEDDITDAFYNSNIEFAGNKMILNTNDFLRELDNEDKKLSFLSEELELADNDLYTLTGENNNEISLDELEDDNKVDSLYTGDDKIQIEFEFDNNQDFRGYDPKFVTENNNDFQIDLYDEEIYFGIDSEYFDYTIDYRFTGGQRFYLDAEDLDSTYIEGDALDDWFEFEIIDGNKINFDISKEQNHYFRDWDDRFVYWADNYNKVMLDIWSVEFEEELTIWEKTGLDWDVDWENVILRGIFDELGNYNSYDLSGWDCSIEWLTDYSAVNNNFELRWHDY